MQNCDDIFIDDEPSSYNISYYINLAYNPEDDPTNIFFNHYGPILQGQQRNHLQTQASKSIQIRQEMPSNQFDIHQNNETLHPIKYKSPFHNFPKHLIGLLKKNVTLSIEKKQTNYTARLAFNLWKQFLKTKSFNKKVLHILFGHYYLWSSSPYQQMMKLTELLPEFKTLFKQNSLAQIMAAQQFMRRHVFEESKGIKKEALKFQCKIIKFDEFFCYYQSFLKEISMGPLRKRMTKMNKIKVMTILSIISLNKILP